MWRGGAEVKEIVHNNNSTCYETDTSLPIPTHTVSHSTSEQHSTTANYAIVNSGASDNYLTPTANVKSRTNIPQPIQVTLLDQSTLRLSHTCQLDLPLPLSAKQGYILPGMKNHSLISVTKMCDAGCQVVFAKGVCSIIHKGTLVMTGHKNKCNGLWYIPIQQTIHNTPFTIYPDTATTKKHVNNSVYHTTTLAETIQYIHQCCFLPTIDTFCKALDNDQLIGFPPITSTQVCKYLPKSTATAKGHLQRVRKHTQLSTRMQETETQVLNRNFRPIIDATTDFELFVGMTIAEQNNGTLYTNQTGAFPVISYHSNKYQFVVYEYRSNAILVCALKDQSDKSLTAAFRDVYEYLTDHETQRH
eukprot:CCRYP_013143-RA/>CCRYP_013143-RA protein AED:0.47 eAED:0.43 QI:0/0/0/1/0/0/2/0/359